MFPAAILQPPFFDMHSLSEYRCNGVVRNIPEFYTAFGVKDGDKLFLKPEDRVKIW